MYVAANPQQAAATASIEGARGGIPGEAARQFGGHASASGCGIASSAAMLRTTGTEDSPPWFLRSAADGEDRAAP
jgi:hypothetical protein